MFFRTEVVEQDRSLRSERVGQRAQRQIGDAVGDDVVHGSIEELLAALGVGWSSHYTTGTGSRQVCIPWQDKLVTITDVIVTSFEEPAVTPDHLAIVSDETSRIVYAYERDRFATVPWSDRWSVGTVARHVAGTHHVVAEIIRRRPDADFGLFNQLQTPPKDSPEFVDWFRSGTASLLEQLTSVPADAECWSWFEPGRRVGWWARRMALEAVVHRWDAEVAQGQESPIASDVAADGVDEFLDVFVAASRSAHDAPAGPTMSFACSDRGDQWWLDLSVRGSRTVRREGGAASVQIRGSAERLLLMVWGRVPVPAGVEVFGEVELVDRWSELVPPI